MFTDRGFWRCPSFLQNCVLGPVCFLVFVFFAVCLPALGCLALSSSHSHTLNYLAHTHAHSHTPGPTQLVLPYSPLSHTHLSPLFNNVSRVYNQTPNSHSITYFLVICVFERRLCRLLSCLYTSCSYSICSITDVISSTDRWADWFASTSPAVWRWWLTDESLKTLGCECDLHTLWLLYAFTQFVQRTLRSWICVEIHLSFTESTCSDATPATSQSSSSQCNS